jgi:hypothetical protein
LGVSPQLFNYLTAYLLLLKKEKMKREGLALQGTSIGETGTESPQPFVHEQKRKKNQGVARIATITMASGLDLLFVWFHETTLWALINY